MILLLTGASHTGKTCFAQQLMETYHIPYQSIDHLKMGLIRSHQTDLTPSDDTQLTSYLWPILREIIKTAIENHQSLILEGCYIPFNWKDSFEADYLKDIRYLCLIFDEAYIKNHYQDILAHVNDMEQRLDDSLDPLVMIRENKIYLEQCIQHQLEYRLIQEHYEITYHLEK